MILSICHLFWVIEEMWNIIDLNVPFGADDYQVRDTQSASKLPQTKKKGRRTSAWHRNHSTRLKIFIHHSSFIYFVPQQGWNNHLFHRFKDAILRCVSWLFPSFGGSYARSFWVSRTSSLDGSGIWDTNLEVKRLERVEQWDLAPARPWASGVSECPYGWFFSQCWSYLFVGFMTLQYISKA